MKMLRPSDDRLNYQKLLAPPTGYELDFAFATTYSLDLETLVSISMTFAMEDAADDYMLENPIYIIENIRKASQKMVILCQSGQMKVPSHSNYIFSLLDDSVFEVGLKDDKSFHPKVWILKFIDKKKNILYRTIILSRNLTFDRSWDISVSLEGEITEEIQQKNNPLIDFLNYNVKFIKNRRKKSKIKSICEELKFIKFETNDKHFYDFDFYPLGFNDYKISKSNLFDTYHSLMIISPFLSKGTIEEFNKDPLLNQKKYLFTRKSEMRKLEDKNCKDFNIYVLKDTIVEGEEIIEEENELNESIVKQDLHAKLYYRMKYTKHDFYIGSANCSYKGFNKNIEFLINLKYRKNGFRIDDLLKDLMSEDETNNPFEKIESINQYEESETSNIQIKIEKAIKRLCASQSKATVTKEGELYNLSIRFGYIPEEVDFEIAPLMNKKFVKLEKNTIIEAQRLVELSEFYIIRARIEDQSLSRMTKVTTVPIPLTREKEIYKHVINDKKAFLKYVAFFLSDNYALSMLEQINPNKSSDIKWDSRQYDIPVIYENMLKTISENPAKILELEHMIKTIDDDNIITDEFKKLYSTFKTVAMKVKK